MRQIRRWVRVCGAGVAVAIVCGFVVACDGDESPVEPLPPATLEGLFGDELYRADGSTESLAALDSVPVIGIYFAAYGCPACGTFTPLLVDAYAELREEGQPFEVVFVSADASASAMLAHMEDRQMPWLAVPWGGVKANGLVQRYGIRWIPTLVVIDHEANTITLNGREQLAQDGAAAYTDWLAASEDD